MKCIKVLFILVIIFIANAKMAHAQGEQFTKTVLNNSYSLRHPFDMFNDPVDDSIWVNERVGIISKISTINGGRSVKLTLPNDVFFTVSGTSIKQDGMLGMSLHPDALKSMGKDSLFVAYAYGNAALRNVRISRFYCNPSSKMLSNETIILNGLPGSDDHNGGKLVFGPDKKIYYSCGDQGANQFGNACVSLKSQLDITAAQVTANNFTNYAGKILRINTDGSIPTDNPTFGGVRSLVYSKGHRNPQGLSFEKDNSGQPAVNAKLYSSEQGAVIDDEVNLIESGKNYGWPFISGYNDNIFYTYKNWSLSSQCGSYGNECQTASDMTGANTPRQESSFTPASLYTDPMISQAAVASPNCSDWLQRPTVAWSSIEHYNPPSGIPGWSNSLLLTTLKNSSVLRYKLNAGETDIVGDTIQYFRVAGALNRFRDIAIGEDGISLYVITDSVGATSGVSAGGGVSATAGSLTDRGKLIRYRFNGAAVILNLHNTITRQNNRQAPLGIKIIPNPATTYTTLVTKNGTVRPTLAVVHNVYGIIVTQYNIANTTQVINTSKLSNGMYAIKFYNRNGQLIESQQLIVQH